MYYWSGEEKEGGARKVFKEIMPESFPNIVKDLIYRFRN